MVSRPSPMGCLRTSLCDGGRVDGKILLTVTLYTFILAQEMAEGDKYWM